jgi:hypothetical protein
MYIIRVLNTILQISLASGSFVLCYEKKKVAKSAQISSRIISGYNFVYFMYFTRGGHFGLLFLSLLLRRFFWDEPDPGS